MCDTSASLTRPPSKPPGPRSISITPVPWSVRLHFMRGKAKPWSVVQITSVLSARPASSRAPSTVPMPWSRSVRLAW